MRIPRILRNAVVIVLVPAAFSPLLHVAHTSTNQGAPQNAVPTVVRIDKTPRGVAYKVGSKPVSLTPTSNLLYLLNRVNDERGANTSVVVLIDPRVPINEIWNVDGVAGKAQLTNLRYFVFDRDTEKMVELKWGPAVPFSTNPN